MTEKTVFLKVEEQNLAVSMGSGSLAVLATPAVVALMEYAASSLANDIIGDKELTTVGTRISIDHTSATPVGAKVTATARLVKQDGRVFEFEVSAADQKGEIARGTHTRVSVNAKRFQQKTDCKFARYKYVLFDLDGTISRSAEGIRASLEHAINELGADMPDLSDYTRYIGPPLIDTFKNLVGLDDEVQEVCCLVERVGSVRNYEPVDVGLGCHLVDSTCKCNPVLCSDVVGVDVANLHCAHVGDVVCAFRHADERIDVELTWSIVRCFADRTRSRNRASCCEYDNGWKRRVGFAISVDGFDGHEISFRPMAFRMA